MNDELLMKFIDGTATSEEVETVLEMLSEDGDAVKEWIQMAKAAQLADSEPSFEVSEEEVLEFVITSLNHDRRKERTNARIVKLPWIVGSSIAIAAVMATFVILPMFRNSIDNDDSIAQLPQDSVEFVPIADSASVESEIPTCREYVADVISKDFEKVDDTHKGEYADAMTNLDDVATAVGGDASFEFKIVHPSKTPYRVKVKNPDKDFVFEWDGHGFMYTELTIVDANGNILIEKILDANVQAFPVKASLLSDKGLLKWIVKVYHSDTSAFMQSGEIEFVSAQ